MTGFQGLQVDVSVYKTAAETYLAECKEFKGCVRTIAGREAQQ